jgi:hypothetical protein
MVGRRVIRSPFFRCGLWLVLACVSRKIRASRLRRDCVCNLRALEWALDAGKSAEVKTVPVVDPVSSGGGSLHCV